MIEDLKENKKLVGVGKHGEGVRVRWRVVIGWINKCGSSPEGGEDKSLRT